MRLLNGYPDAWGAKLASVFPHTGPASYTQVTIAAGVAIVPGDTVQAAAEAGMKYFDHLNGAVSDDGFWTARAVPNGPSNSIQGAPCTSYTLMWIANKTAAFGGQNQTAGVEAVATTDLSTAIVRLLAIGHN